MQVFVDAREHKFAELLRDEGISVHVQALKTGDVMIFGRGRTWIFERKTMSVFISGYTSVGAPWPAERSRMAGEVAHSKAVTVDVLLIGIRPEIDSQRHGYGKGMSGNELWAAIADLKYNYGIGVIPFTTDTNAARFVAHIVCRRLEKGCYDEGVAEADRDCEPPARDRKRKRGSSADEIMSGMLARLSGVSAQKAKAVVEAFHPRLDFNGATEKQIGDLVVGPRRIGPALAKVWMSLTTR
jgi:ERCC4-type nuclease